MRDATRPAAQRGFSLIELLVVITIIGILATVVGVKVFGAVGQARRVKAKSDIAEMKKAIGIYRLNTMKIPDSLEQLKEPMPDKGFDEGIFEGSLKDPWGHDYFYEKTSSTKFHIISYGGDNAPGGEGEDADIDSEKMDEEQAAPAGK